LGHVEKQQDAAVIRRNLHVAIILFEHSARRSKVTQGDSGKAETQDDEGGSLREGELGQVETANGEEVGPELVAHLPSIESPQRISEPVHIQLGSNNAGYQESGELFVLNVDDATGKAHL
jgi:hypothetical protein